MFRKVLSLLLAAVLAFNNLGFSMPVSSFSEVNGPGVIQLDGFRFDKGAINFIWSKEGQMISEDDKKSPEFKKALAFFFTALAIPKKDWWVNLNVFIEEGIIAGRGLAYTELGRALLDADLRLKKMAMEIMGENEDLADALLDADLDDVRLRFWVEPKYAQVQARENAVVIKKVGLRVRVECSDNALQGLLEEQVAPVLERRINRSKEFSELRSAYKALILAQVYKDRFPGRVKRIDETINRYALPQLSAGYWSRKEYLVKFTRLYFMGAGDSLTGIDSGGFVSTALNPQYVGGNVLSTYQDKNDKEARIEFPDSEQEKPRQADKPFLKGESGGTSIDEMFWILTSGVFILAILPLIIGEHSVSLSMYEGLAALTVIMSLALYLKTKKTYKWFINREHRMLPILYNTGDSNIFFPKVVEFMTNAGQKEEATLLGLYSLFNGIDLELPKATTESGKLGVDEFIDLTNSKGIRKHLNMNADNLYAFLKMISLVRRGKADLGKIKRVGEVSNVSGVFPIYSDPTSEVGRYSIEINLNDTLAFMRAIEKKEMELVEDFYNILGKEGVNSNDVWGILVKNGKVDKKAREDIKDALNDLLESDEFNGAKNNYVRLFYLGQFLNQFGLLNEQERDIIIFSLLQNIIDTKGSPVLSTIGYDIAQGVKVAGNTSNVKIDESGFSTLPMFLLLSISSAVFLSLFILPNNVWAGVDDLFLVLKSFDWLFWGFAWIFTGFVGLSYLEKRKEAEYFAKDLYIPINPYDRLSWNATIDIIWRKYENPMIVKDVIDFLSSNFGITLIVRRKYNPDDYQNLQSYLDAKIYSAPIKKRILEAINKNTHIGGKGSDNKVRVLVSIKSLLLPIFLLPNNVWVGEMGQFFKEEVWLVIVALGVIAPILFTLARRILKYKRETDIFLNNIPFPSQEKASSPEAWQEVIDYLAQENEYVARTVAGILAVNGIAIKDMPTPKGLRKKASIDDIGLLNKVLKKMYEHIEKERINDITGIFGTYFTTGNNADIKALNIASQIKEAINQGDLDINELIGIITGDNISDEVLEKIKDFCNGQSFKEMNNTEKVLSITAFLNALNFVERPVLQEIYIDFVLTSGEQIKPSNIKAGWDEARQLVEKSDENSNNGFYSEKATSPADRGGINLDMIVIR